MIRPPLDPDPLYIEAMEQAAWDEGYERGIRDSIPPLIGLLLASIVAAIVGGMLGWSIAQFTAPRSAATAIPATSPAVRASAGASGNLSLPFGAPRAGMLADARADAGRVVADHAAEVGAPLVPAAEASPVAGDLTAFGGIATWYDAPTAGDAAAGPPLRIGNWRGRQVTVRYGGRSIVVRLTDWCACPGRLIDLDDRAFARLAPLSRGILFVTVTTGGPALPATDAP